VKALGVRLDPPAEAEAGLRGLVQVTMNVTDYERTSLASVFAVVAQEAKRDGIEIAGSEIIGLVPAAALDGVDPRALGLDLTTDRILEHRLRDTAPR
jgi:glutamate formiminotransferase